jgi:antitoxin (DNA-binding transcriptional repressor) of toxin-antitoxin stability system
VYTAIHAEEMAVATTKVGVREFRAALADYIDADSPVAVTRHGQTVGYFIPAKSDREAEAASLRTAAAKLDALLSLDETEVDDMVEDFKGLRKQGKRAARS